MSSIDILVPELPDSVANATVITWSKKPGDRVTRNEVLAEIETDKVVLEILAPTDGILNVILKKEGTTVTSRQILGRLCDKKKVSKRAYKKNEGKSSNTHQYPQISTKKKNYSEHTDNELFSSSLTVCSTDSGSTDSAVIKKTSNNCQLAIRKKLNKKLVSHLTKMKEASKLQMARRPTQSQFDNVRRSERRVPMNQLRKRIAERLLAVTRSTAMLTTFNEVNMKAIIDLRKQYSEFFKKRHGIYLSFMPFYIKAVIEGLKHYSEINAFIDGDNIVYHNYFDISIAVSTPRGLVTPVLHDVDTCSLFDIEKKIRKLATKGRNGKFKINDLIGGNFTVTNGGVFGSLLSTPIINPPQSAILGIHAIKDRPMAVNGKIEILPMMYLALSYDHRLIDGREAVSFLMLIKELLEDPIRLILAM